jgi:hypothetical protein
MQKLDLRKQWKHLYQPTNKEFTVVEVPLMNFFMVDGRGDPNTSEEFQAAVQALYGMSYNIKFTSKKQLGIDYGVMALEGLWWGEDPAVFLRGDKSAFIWTLMMMQPDHITPALVEAARIQVAKKGESPALEKLRFERFHEGLSVQIMYLGSYADEGPTIARMHEFIAQNGYEFNGKHHEIYVGDPRRSEPAKLKTVLRHPVRKR